MKLQLFRYCIGYVFCFVFASFSQLLTDPLPYAPIANPLPDTMDQLYRDSINLVFSPIRINQAGYRTQDKKYFYYVGSGASNFSVINESGTAVGTGSLRSTGQSASGQLRIKASNNAQLVNNGDTRYIMEGRIYSGTIMEGEIPDLPPGVYRVVVGTNTSVPFVIDEKIYSWVRDALLKFYGANRCGDSNSWFHPPCHLKDAVTGGWHDCGDHLKEGATMGYTASVLGLAAAVFDNRDQDVYSANQAVTQITDGIPDILYEAKHGADFILQSYDKAGGQVAGMITSVGSFQNDHMWWGRPESQDNMPTKRGGPPRDARNEVTSDYLGNYAANLAFVSKRYEPYDADYSAKCLKAAEAIYAFTKTRMDLTNTPAYNGATIVSDDLAFACLALLWATGERKYLDELCYDKTIGEKQSAAASPKALFEGGWFTNNDPVFTKTMANTDWGSVQAHVLWGFYRLILENDSMCTLLQISESERLKLMEKTMYNLISNLAGVGQGTQTIELPNHGIWTGYTVKYGLPWFTMHTQMEWVWNRYQAGNITEMFYYYDIASRIQGMELPNTPASTDWKADEVKTILVRMLDYQLGINPWDISMIYGIGEKNFNHPHHRAANPEGKNVPGAFYRYRPPVGALQGGFMPTTSLYDEFWSDYFHSETGIDGTTNILMPVIGLAKDDTLGPPTATVRIVYVGCNEAVIEIRQSRFGNATVRYGAGSALDKVQGSDSTGVLHRVTLSGLTQGTTYIFDVEVSDLFGRSSVIKYIDEEKKPVYFSFTTLPNCPTNAEISNVKVCRVTSDSAEIFWYTPNGNFNSRVVYGEQRPPTTVHEGDVTGLPARFHYVKIGGLKEQTTYYFYVESGESRDDNNGLLYQFTTPVEHVNFDIRALRYTWQDMASLGFNIINQDKKAYDSLDIRIYFRAKEGFENDLAARMDIGIVYHEDGYQAAFEENQDIRYNIMHSRPVKMDDTYNPADQTYAYYFSIPLWGVQMKSGSRIRLDIIFDRRSPWPPYEDLMNQPPEHVITDLDWSFGPHSRAGGDPVDFPGVPILSKDAVDSSYWNQPINNYMTVYRKGEYVWGYSPSQEEMKTKKTFYTMQSQITSPLNNPSADYVFYERPIRSVDVSGWATVEPSDGTLNEIWVNGVKLANPASLFAWSEPEKRYNFTIPVPVQNGRNIVDVTLFSGPPLTCEECYGCAVSNHHFYIEFQGAKQYPSILVLRDEAMQPAGDTMKLDTSKFHIQVTDRNGNQNGKSPDLVTVWIKNFDNSDSISVILNETGDSTGIFVTSSPISVVDRMPEESGAGQIAMNGGDRVRIWYIDPTDSTDSSEAYITSRATFPRAVRGWLKDVNGDGSVDHMVVEYTIAVKVNPDSISVNFPSSGTTIMTRNSVDMMNIEGSRVTVGFAQPLANGITGFTSALYGSGMSYLTSGGLVRRSVFEVYDSVGPVLNDQAVVSERGAPGDDTVEITLSEFVKNTGLAGEELFLRRGGIDHPVTVIRILSENPEQYSMTVLCNVGETSFTAGDSLRFNSAGQVSDFAGNGPHPENRAVPVRIKAALPRIIDASYLDTNADGIIDLVRMEFSKDIDLELVDIGIEWNRQKIVTVDSLCTFVPGSSVQMTIAIGESFTNNIVGTGAAVRCAMVASGNSADTIFTEVNDGAAPVIDSAWFNLYSGELTGAPVIDTLRIAFSETTDSESVKTITVFGLMNGRQIPYTFYVDSCRMLTLRDYLFYGRIEGVEFPRTGDLIWLHPTSSVSDAGGNIQQSIDNRRAPVIVSFEVVKPGSIKKFVYPNPFNPDKGPVMIRLAPPVGLRFPVEIDSSAWMVFYDKVGNKITDKIHSVLNGTDAVLYWNGINKKGRKVGEGTYLCYLYFLGEKEKVPIGVIRE